MEGQLKLFHINKAPVPDRFGQAQVSLRDNAQILTPASGFMEGYDFTLNPYIGCQFGCAYCYASFFVNSDEKRENWGYWVEVKHDAVEYLNKRRKLYGKKIYMSSVTDPYQPIEAKVELTRGIVESMSVRDRQPRLVIQTRSPLVTRDIDLLKKYSHMRVNMTVTTDSEAIRKRFEPLCPSNERRMAALDELKRAGIRTCVCITPMLPLENVEQFAKQVAALKADMYVVQPFKPSQGRYAASTRQIALDILRECEWNESKYRNAVNILRRHVSILYEGKEGFIPE
ncbi:MAG: radical SAM protein [Pyrinomonadaceae bacterium]